MLFQRVFMMSLFLKHMPLGLFSGVVVVAILFLTLYPHPLPEVEVSVFEWFDKVGHFFMFGGLCFAVSFDLRLACVRGRVSAPRRQWFRSLAVAFASIVFGGVIELLQWFMALGRTAELADFVADVLGALVFAFVSPVILPYIIRSKGALK